MHDKAYNYVDGCQSLLGYGRVVHLRSGGICALCGCGGGSEVNFDLWRQFTVEHLIGQSQGGYLRDVRVAVRDRFSGLPVAEAEVLAVRIDELNTVSACSFCNSTTSRDRNPKTMRQLLDEVDGTADQIIERLRSKFAEVLERKRADVAWKLESIRPEFTREVEPVLRKARHGAEPAKAN